ncbi:MAG: N-acetylglucosamine-6-phosphate deacetylase [Chitinophagaceae bacterium]
MSALTFYTAPRIFTGESWLEDHALVIRAGVIEEILPVAQLPAAAGPKHITGFIAPAFIDLQIYGAHGKLLAVYPEADALAKLVEYCRQGGAAWCQPTVATNTNQVMYRCIDAVREYWASGRQGVLGLHLEGPWINPVKRGAHIESLIHVPAEKEVAELLEYGRGVITMITLAPEQCSDAVIDLILSHHIIISAGHSNATYKEATQAFEKGITAVTHLYNAMSPLQHRGPGLTGAAMSHDKVRASIIPDGHHVDYVAVKLARQVMQERLFAITDAVTETTEGYYQHYLAGDKYEAAGILSGSALTMQKALYNLVHHAGVEPAEAVRMCSLYPAQVMRMDDRLGKIAPGYRAEMVGIDDGLTTATLL